MIAPLLPTKLSLPPLQKQFVPRAAACRKLDEGRQARLTLVSAPPGYGKTTFAANSLSQRGEPIAWYSLDQQDNDPQRFFAYLVGAFQRFNPDIGQSTQSLLGSGLALEPRHLVSTLVSDLQGYQAQLVLVLDDFHLIREERILQVIQEFIEHRPENLQIIIIAREDPFLPLHLWRGRNEVVEIRERDLRFSQPEAGEFLQQLIGLNLRPDTLGDLVERTEGWPAGILMAALAIESLDLGRSQAAVEEFIHGFHGDDRLIMDYLMEEVFSRQSPAMQDFLLRTSILERLCAPLCAALLQFPADFTEQDRRLAAQNFLEHLERRQLFLTPLDHRRQWYSYHQLVSDLLRYWLERGTPALIPELHEKAARWFREAGEGEQALHHALSVPDFSLAADIAEESLLSMLGGSQLAAYGAWLQRLPEPVIASRPYLCAGCGWVELLLRWQPVEAERYAVLGEQALAGFNPVFNPATQRWIDVQEVRGQLASIRAHAARLQGDAPRAIQLSKQALADLPAEVHVVRCALSFNLGLLLMAGGDLEGARTACLEAVESALKSNENLNIALSALSSLAGMSTWQGRLHEAEGYCRQAFQAGVKPGKLASDLAVAFAHGWMSAIHIQRRELALAREQLEQALRYIFLMGLPVSRTYALLWFTRLELEGGDIQAAEKQLREVDDMLSAQPAAGSVLAEWALNHARLALTQGNPPLAREWLEKHGISAGDLAHPAGMDGQLMAKAHDWLPAYGILARAMLRQQEWDQASALLENLAALARGLQNMEVLLEALALRAILAGQRGKNADGLDLLEQALALGEGEGYVAPFLYAGHPLASLLRQAVAQGSHPAYASRLLSALEDQLRLEAQQITLPPPSAPGRVGLESQLTERERQVLRLLAAGSTSTQIAESLVISVNTARSYIKALYAKLGVHSRAEALQKFSKYP